MQVSILTARRRLVSFRLTQEELENLKVACLMQGARNTSDFARNAVLQLAEARVHPGEQVLSRLTGIETTLTHQGEMLRALLKGLVKEVVKQA